jgi:2-polyprenyl-3-methyl-5-hydroxy-6-metoxy-1,4-benzoquinol methylase
VVGKVQKKMNLNNYKSFLSHDMPNAVFRANKALAEFTRLKFPTRLLDIGCGSGELLRIAQNIGVQNLAGVDGVQDALEKCRDIQGEIRQVDLNKTGLPFPDEAFDGVTCLEVLEHLYDPQNTLREIFRVLEKGSCAIISVPNPFSYAVRARVLFGSNVSDPATIGGHIKFFRSSDIRKMCMECGFQNIEIHGLPYPTAYKKYGCLADKLVRRMPDLFATWLFVCCKKSD